MVVDFYICRRSSSCFVNGAVDGSTDDEVDGSTDDDGENSLTEGEADDLWMVKCYVSMDDEVDALTDDEDKSLTLKYNGYERLESTGILKIKFTMIWSVF